MRGNDRENQTAAEARLQAQWQRAVDEVARRQAEQLGGQAGAKVDFVEVNLGQEFSAKHTASPVRNAEAMAMVAELALPGGVVLRIFAPERPC